MVKYWEIIYATDREMNKVNDSECSDHSENVENTFLSIALRNGSLLLSNIQSDVHGSRNNCKFSF